MPATTPPPAETPEELAERLLDRLREHADPVNVAGMRRFGISEVGTLGVSMTVVRGLAAEAKRALGRRDEQGRHQVAQLLWDSGVHEARLMATVVEVPALVTYEQALAWATAVDSWDTCDQLCGNLLWHTAFAWELTALWASRPETFVKRAGLVMAAQLTKDKKRPDDCFVPLLAVVRAAAFDERNDVKKSASWALRQIGKRSAPLNRAAIEQAEGLLGDALAVSPATPASSAARWVARDVLRELRSEPVRRRLGTG